MLYIVKTKLTDKSSDKDLNELLEECNRKDIEVGYMDDIPTEFSTNSIVEHAQYGSLCKSIMNMSLEPTNSIVIFTKGIRKEILGVILSNTFLCNTPFIIGDDDNAIEARSVIKAVEDPIPII